MRDILTCSIEKIDLPALVCELWPEAGSQAGASRGMPGGVARGYPPLALCSGLVVSGSWKDHATGEGGNAFHLLLRAGMSKEAAAEIIKSRAEVSPPEARYFRQRSISTAPSLPWA